ncbi:MAG: heme exporter protein CcmD [Rhodospirillaceae bacterium]|nr:heme exporter protein CcmD [Rhodospirillaceae bacterium]
MISLEAVIDMGGYAAFVWPAYALAVVGLGVLFILTARSVKMQQAELDRLRLPRSGPTSGSSGQAGGTAGSGT